MNEQTTSRSHREVCRLEWLVNSRCDYACKGCVAVATARRDLDLDARLAALRSFVEFAAARSCDAQVTLYPRQAAFAESFTAVLDVVRDLKRQGRIGRVTCANRGDLPGEKIRLYRDAGVDVCRLTIDGPQAVQDGLRRPGSFGDTLRAFREAQACGLGVVPQMIVISANASCVAETMRMMLDEGFDGLSLQVAIRGDAGSGELVASLHPDPDSPFNRLLTAAEYRSVLLSALAVLDSAGEQAREARTRFVLDNPMCARLFFELGRIAEYEQWVAGRAFHLPLQFVLKPDGAVLPDSLLPEIGAFPLGEFSSMFASGHPMRWFDSASSFREYLAARQRAFFKCRACPVAIH